MLCVFERLLVPLDGSVLGEAILPWVTQIGATVPHPWIVLCRALPKAPDGGLLEASAIHYLREIAATLPAPERVETAVAFGTPVDTILSIAKRCGVTAVALATGGRGGRDSVAEAVVQRVKIPVILLHPEEALVRADDGVIGALR